MLLKPNNLIWPDSTRLIHINTTVLCVSVFWVILISPPFGFKQQSAPLAEKETLPGPTFGQDREPDKQPGADGEQSEGFGSHTAGSSSCSVRLKLSVSLLLISGSRSGVCPDWKESDRWLESWKWLSEEDARGRRWLKWLKGCNLMSDASHLTGHGQTLIDCFLTLGDVYWRCRTDYGWNPGFHWVPKGKSQQWC